MSRLVPSSHFEKNRASGTLKAEAGRPYLMKMSMLKLVTLSLIFAPLVVCLPLAETSAAGHPPMPSGKSVYGKLPIGFEPNRGQTDGRVKFLARGPGYTVYLQPNSATFQLLHAIPAAKGSTSGPNTIEQAVVRMNLLGSSSEDEFFPSDQLPGTASFMTGNNRAGWHIGLPLYSRVAAHQVYPGINLVYYGTDGRLEYDFQVAPGANADHIRFQFEGATPTLQADGSLELILGDRQVSFAKPVLYQQRNGQKVLVEGRFVVEANAQVRFAIGPYDHTRELVIDPVLLYSSYLGGSTNDTFIYGIALDANKNIYVTGATAAPDFPTTAGVLQPTCGTSGTHLGNKCGTGSGGVQSAAFVSKIAADGKSLIYSTYLGGSGEGEGTDYGFGIALDAADNAWIIGSTLSNNFPITSNAYQKYCSPVSTTNDNPGYSGIQSSCYSTGQGEYEYGHASIFVAELNPTGTKELYGTFFGGSGGAGPVGIAVDSTGVYIAGSEFDYFSTPVPAGPFYNFPITPSAYQTTGFQTVYSMFVAKFDPTGADLQYSSLLSGNSESPSGNLATAMTVQDGKILLGGETLSPSFPTTSNALRKTCAAPSESSTDCDYQGAVAIIDPGKSGSASLLFSTYLSGTTPLTSINGTAATQVNSIASDTAGNVYAGGGTNTSDFPTTAGVLQPSCPVRGTSAPLCDSGFVTKFSPTGTLIWSTYYGGTTDNNNQDLSTSVQALAVDKNQDVYVSGFSVNNSTIPTLHSIQAFQTDAAFVGVLNPNATNISFGTYFGDGTGSVFPYAMALDNASNVYLVGYAKTGVPLANAFQTTNSGGYNQGFFAKIATLPQVSKSGFTSSSYTYTVGGTTNIIVDVTGLPDIAIPTGSVTFSVGGNPLVSVNLSNSGSATLAVSTATEPAGTYSLVATYNGDNVYASSSATVQVVLQAISTTTALTASPNPATAGQQITLTAKIKAASGGTPGGNVVFTSGTTTLGTIALNKGVATLTASSHGLPAGSYPVKAAYQGSTSDAKSAGSTTVVLK